MYNHYCIQDLQLDIHSRNGKYARQEERKMEVRTIITRLITCWKRKHKSVKTDHADGQTGVTYWESGWVVVTKQTGV